MTSRRSSSRTETPEPLHAGPADDPDEYELYVQFPPAEGSQGKVYLARHKVARRWHACALKVRHRFPDESNEVAETAVRQWINQSVDAAECEHPGLVPVLDAFVGPSPHPRGEQPRGEDLYFVTKWQDGLVLHDWRHSRRSWLGAALDRLGLAGTARNLRALLHPPARMLLRPIVQVAGGLDCLHEHGLVHGDVKPSNIIVHRNRGVLVDYGSLLRIDRRPIAGTVDYAAPPEYRGQAAGDLFSLGCVAFFLLSGQSPTVNGAPRSGPDVAGMLGALERNPLVREIPEVRLLMREALQPSGRTLAPGAVGQWASALHLAAAGRAAPLERLRARWSFWYLRTLVSRLVGALPRGLPLPPRSVWITVVALAVAAWGALVAGVERFALAAGAASLLLWWLLRGPRSRLVLAVGALVLIALVGSVLRVASWVDDAPPPVAPDGGQVVDPPRGDGTDTPFQSGATDLPGPVLLSDAALDGRGESEFRELPSESDGLTIGVERYAYTGTAEGITVSVELTASNEGTADVSMATRGDPPAFVLLVSGSVPEPWYQAEVSGAMLGFRVTGAGLLSSPIERADVLAVPPALGSQGLPYGANPVERWETAWNGSPLVAGSRRGGREGTDDRLTFSVPAPDEGTIRLVGIAYLGRDGDARVFAASDRWGNEGDPYTYQVPGDAVHEDDLRPDECVGDPVSGNPYRPVVPC